MNEELLNVLKLLEELNVLTDVINPLLIVMIGLRMLLIGFLFKVINQSD